MAWQHVSDTSTRERSRIGRERVCQVRKTKRRLEAKERTKEGDFVLLPDRGQCEAPFSLFGRESNHDSSLPNVCFVRQGLFLPKLVL